MPNPKSQIPNPKSLRRGGTYIIVVGSALIVSTLGMMALLQQRIQRRGFEAAANAEQARLNIESALRLGLLDIERDPNWRSTYAASSGEVLSESSADFGDVVLEALDPHDNDLSDDENDPVVLRATATVDGARQLGELMLHPTRTPPDVLKKGVVAGGNFSASGGTIRSERAVSCSVASLTSANLYADVEAVSFGGSTYHGDQVVVLEEDRSRVPDMSTLIAEYTSRGTAISVSSLPTSTPNLVRNPGMELPGVEGGPADHWFAESGSYEVVQTEAEKHSGNMSLLAKGRSSPSEGPIQYCTDWVKPNVTYRVRGYIRVPGLLSLPTVRLKWYVDGAVSGQQTQGAVANLLELGSWKELTVDMQAGSWSGELLNSYIKVECEGTLGSSPDFYLDDFSIVEINRRFIYRQVLSPSVNPFGTGATNAEGIYVIDCADLPVVIERSRIRGTLVLLNPGAGTGFEGPISCQPAKLGYPALLVGSTGSNTANMKIAPSRRGLNEKLNATNYNPSGTPHDAIGENSHQNDIMPSEIRGWIYVGDTLTFRNRPTIHGVVMAGGDIIAGGEPRIYWDPSPLYHAPPGLEGKLELKPRAGASTKAVE